MRSVLVVDDDAAVRQLIRAILLREGYDVTEAGSGAEGLRLLSTRSFGAIILDLMMPTSGYDVLQSLAAAKPLRRNVIVVTAASPKQIDQINRAAVHCVIRKPFDIDDLRQRVRELMPDLLIVEDDPADQYLIERRLRAEGYRVTVAGTGERALLNLTEHAYDAMIVDLKLPGISGYDVIRQSRVKHALTPTIVLTHVEDFEEPLSVDAILQKRNGLDQLVPALNALIGR